MGQRSCWRLAVLLSLVGGLMADIGTPPAAATLPREIGVVSSVQGRVVVKRVVGQSQPLKSGDPLYLGDTVEARDGGAARVVLKGKDTVTIRAFSSLRIEEERKVMGASYSVDLLFGMLRSSADRALMHEGTRTGERSRNAVASIRG